MTVMAESSVEMTRGSSERTAFFSGSILTPIQARRSATPARISGAFSPMPAVKAMVSTPSIEEAISAKSWAVR